MRPPPASCASRYGVQSMDEREVGGHTPLARRTREVRESEEERLAPLATRSLRSRGRARREEPDPYRTAFERDRDRILHSKAFRRLKHKTQVFMNPEGDHYVTRLTHALQVTQVARALAAGLGLNEALAEAIALGHDVGHSPFGHTGEDALAEYFTAGWYHGDQGVRIFEVLEDSNLTWEVRDGIRSHTWRIEPPPATPEGLTVRFADRIAYLTHDALDAMRAGMLTPRDFPGEVRRLLGEPGRQWIGALIDGVIEHSAASGKVAMDPALLDVMGELRAFMFERLYLAGDNLRQRTAATTVIRQLVEHHLARPEDLPDSYRDSDADVLTQVADYVSGMTDRYALRLHDQLFRPRLFPLD
jgi:dGTPase